MPYFPIMVSHSTLRVIRKLILWKIRALPQSKGLCYHFTISILWKIRGIQAVKLTGLTMSPITLKEQQNSRLVIRSLSGSSKSILVLPKQILSQLAQWCYVLLIKGMRGTTARWWKGFSYQFHVLFHTVASASVCRSDRAQLLSQSAAGHMISGKLLSLPAGHCCGPAPAHCHANVTATAERMFPHPLQRGLTLRLGRGVGERLFSYSFPLPHPRG